MILDLETDAIRTSVLEMNLYLKKVLSSIFFSVCVLHGVLPAFPCCVTVYEAGYR